MTRLTQWSRDKIIAAVLDDTFKARKKKLREREHALAIRVRDHALGKHKKAFLSLPDKLIPKDDGVYVNAAGKRVELGFEGKHPRPHGNRYSAPEAFAAGSPICKAIERFLAAQEKYQEDFDRVRVETRAILNSVTTEKRLVEAWPSVKKFLPEHAEANLPAIRAEDLDKTLSECRKAA